MQKLAKHQNALGQPQPQRRRWPRLQLLREDADQVLVPGYGSFLYRIWCGLDILQATETRSRAVQG